MLNLVIYNKKIFIYKNKYRPIYLYTNIYIKISLKL